MKNKIFTIAEIGINHNGDIDIAKSLIDMAVRCGFDSVKFQKRTIDKVYSKEQLDSPRESPWGNTTREQKEGLEFNLDDYKNIDEYCKKNNIEWFASAWDIDSINFLSQFNLKYNKVASAMIIDLDFLKHLSKQKKHTFISTGMSSNEDIKKAVEIFNNNNCPFELMHCVSTYPMEPSDANLLTIQSLKDEYKCNVGYSGHEAGLAVSYAAASLGISSLERHITLDRAMYGSDQSASLEERGAKELIGTIEKILISYGEPKLGYITKEEAEVAKKLRSHIEIK